MTPRSFGAWRRARAISGDLVERIVLSLQDAEDVFATRLLRLNSLSCVTNSDGIGPLAE